MSALVVGGASQERHRLCDAIRVRGYQAQHVSTPQDAALFLRTRQARLLVLLDVDATPGDRPWIHTLLREHPALQVLGATVNDALLVTLPPPGVVWVSAEFGELLREVSAALVAGYLSPAEDSNSGADLASLRRVYMLRLPQQVREIDTALANAGGDQGPLDLVRHLAHRMRGAAPSYGQARMGAVAAQLEVCIEEAFGRLEVTRQDWHTFGRLVAAMPAAIESEPSIDE